MTGDDRANGIPMILWQVVAVHLVGNKDLASHRLVTLKTARVGDGIRRYGRLFRRSPVGSFEHNLADVLPQPGSLQQVGQGNTGPLGVADGTKSPLSPIGLGYEKDPAVPRAFQRGDSGLRGHLAQLLVAERKRVLDRSIDLQPVGADIQRGGREMTADVEQLRGGEEPAV